MNHDVDIGVVTTVASVALPPRQSLSCLLQNVHSSALPTAAAAAAACYTVGRG